jgi:hypothetical protein
MIRFLALALLLLLPAAAHAAGVCEPTDAMRQRAELMAETAPGVPPNRDVVDAIVAQAVAHCQAAESAVQRQAAEAAARRLLRRH